MDSIDWVIVILPFLAILDIASTLYVQSLGNPNIHEVGLFASYFVSAGLLLLFIPIYILLIIGISFALWSIKKRLKPTQVVDKIIFLFLVVVACYIYIVLTEAFIMNFFLPSIIERGIGLFYIQLLIFASSALSLIFFIWHDIVVWVKSSEENP